MQTDATPADMFGGALQESEGNEEKESEMEMINDSMPRIHMDGNGGSERRRGMNGWRESTHLTVGTIRCLSAFHTEFVIVVDGAIFV